MVRQEDTDMKDRVKPKTGIRRKAVFFISLTGLIMAIVGISSGYFLGFRLLRDTIGVDHVRMAQMVGIAMGQIIDKKVETIKVYMSHSLRIAEVEKHNLKYRDMGNEAIQDYFKEMDKIWGEEIYDEALVREYVDGPVDIRLKQLAEEDKDIAEIFMADRFGGLVSSSGKTSDFYQADEEWWQKAFDNGKGKVFIGDVEFDKSSNVLSVSIAVPIKDSSEKAIGVCKAVLDIRHFFELLTKFRLGTTGHAIMIDEKGNILFHKGIEPLSVNLLREEDFERISKRLSASFWTILDKTSIHEEKILICFAPVGHRLLLENGIKWILCISQGTKEVFSPLNALFVQLVWVCGILFMVLAFLVFVLSGAFIRPIKELQKAAERIAQGDLSYKVQLKTGDELEEFADSFNRMTESLKTSTTSIDNLNREIAERKKAEEELRDAYDKLRETQAQLIQMSKMAAIGQLASGIAHEINNPLTGVLNNVQLIKTDLRQKKKFEVKEFQEVLGVVEESASRCKNIIRSLLDFARVSRGPFQPLSLNTVVEQAAAVLGLGGKMGNIVIERHLQSDLPQILGDTQLLQQAIFNILVDAKWAIDKKSKEGGAITIKTQYEPRKNTVLLSISDTGIGIPKENIDRIFEPFFTTKPAGEGVGLGLPITYNIIQQHNGAIEAESRVGQGATFKIYLPILEK